MPPALTVASPVGAESSPLVVVGVSVPDGSSVSPPVSPPPCSDSISSSLFVTTLPPSSTSIAKIRESGW